MIEIYHRNLLCIYVFSHLTNKIFQNQKIKNQKHDVCSYFHLDIFLFASLRRKIRTRLMWFFFYNPWLASHCTFTLWTVSIYHKKYVLILFSNIPGNYFLIHQPIIFLYERGLLIYIIYLIGLISVLCSCANFFIILNLPAGVLLIPWLWFFALYYHNSYVQY